MSCNNCGKPRMGLGGVPPSLDLDKLEDKPASELTGQEQLELERAQRAQASSASIPASDSVASNFIRYDMNVFSALCAQKMIAKQPKYGDSWRTMPASHLQDKLVSEFQELLFAIQSENPLAIADECRDVANMCMMIFVQTGGVSHIAYNDERQRMVAEADALFEKQKKEEGARY